MASARPSPPAEPSGFFVMRTPLRPLSTVRALRAELATPSAGDDEATLAAAIEADRTRVRERIEAALADPDVRAAIEVASPHLTAALAAPRGPAAGRPQPSLPPHVLRL